MGRAFEFRKERKMKRWSKMAKQFTRVGKDIAMAVKESGPDPDTNPRLRMVLQNAKAINMPKDNIERAIKKAADKNNKEDFEETVFEGHGPGGIAIIIETATDNNNRTVANIRSYFTKCDGNLGTNGSVDYMFDRKCHFKIKAEGIDLEELEFELIDFGAEEVFADQADEEAEYQGPVAMIYGDFTNFGNLQSELENKNVEIIESGLERIPQNMMEVGEDQQTMVNKLLDLIEEDDDVMNVFHNMK